MPRRPRIKLADIPQHLVQRGVNREPCFFAEEDCHCYLHWLQEAADDWREGRDGCERGTDGLWVLNGRRYEN